MLKWVAKIGQINGTQSWGQFEAASRWYSRKPFARRKSSSYVFSQAYSEKHSPASLGCSFFYTLPYLDFIFPVRLYSRSWDLRAGGKACNWNVTHMIFPCARFVVNWSWITLFILITGETRMKKNGTQFCWEIRGYVLPQKSGYWKEHWTRIRSTVWVLSLFLINYITFDNPFGILESPFSHYKIGDNSISPTTLQGYCVYNPGDQGRSNFCGVCSLQN